MRPSLSKKRQLLTLTPNPVLDLGGVVTKVIPDEKVYVRNEPEALGGTGLMRLGSFTVSECLSH